MSKEPNFRVGEKVMTKPLEEEQMEITAVKVCDGVTIYVTRTRFSGGTIISEYEEDAIMRFPIVEEVPNEQN